MHHQSVFEMICNLLIKFLNRNIYCNKGIQFICIHHQSVEINHSFNNIVNKNNKLNLFLILFSSFSWLIDSETNWVSLDPHSERRENTKLVLRFGVSLLSEKDPGETMQFVLGKNSYMNSQSVFKIIKFANTKFELKHILQSGFTIYMYTSLECQNKSFIKQYWN